MSDEEVSCSFTDTTWDDLATKWDNLNTTLRTCEIQNLKEPEFIISSPSDATVEGFYVEDNLKVESLPENISEKFPKLVRIDASNCSIKTVKEDNFKRLHELIYLNLETNKIEIIHEYAFKDNTKLEYLSLSNNKIKFLSENVFATLAILEELHLGNNRIEFISPKAFQNFKKIEQIYSDFNKIRFFDSRTFENLVSLEVLSFCDNELEKIDEDLFKTNVNLEHIRFTNNNMKSISPKLFENKNNLDYVDLSDNFCIDEAYVKDSFDEMRATLKQNCSTESELQKAFEMQLNATIANLEKQLEAANSQIKALEKQDEECKADKTKLETETIKATTDLITANSGNKNYLDFIQKFYDDLKLETKELRNNLELKTQQYNELYGNCTAKIQKLERDKKILIGLN